MGTSIFSLKQLVLLPGNDMKSPKNLVKFHFGCNFIKKKGGNMTTDYLCPHCKGHLLLDNHLILTVKHENQTGMMLLLNPEIGNYQTMHHKSHVIEEGQKFDFYCPICHHKLLSDLNENLVMVLMKDEKDKTFELHFSRIAGQKSTYKIMGKEVQTFGIDAPHYLDFMHLIDMS